MARRRPEAELAACRGVLRARAWFALEGDWSGPLTWTRADGREGRLENAELEALATDLADGEKANADGAFLLAAQAGKPAWPDFATVVRAHEVTDAVYRSAASGGVPVDAH